MDDFEMIFFVSFTQRELDATEIRVCEAIERDLSEEIELYFWARS